MRILVVDDFETTRMMTHNYLRDLGFTRIDQGTNGKQALEALFNGIKNSDPYSLCILDWQMPEMTGIEVLKACRKDPLLAKLPIIMMTAESETESVTEAIIAGSSEYLIKPLTKPVLKDRLQKVLKIKLP